MPSSFTTFLDYVRRSGLLDAKRFEEYLQQFRATSGQAADPVQLADALIRDGLLTQFQADQLLRGKYRNFIINGKYKLLERLGAGGMGSVFLCEHQVMRRRVAIKVLPAAQADDPSALERFHREARAVAQLHHPNIVTAYDIDQDRKLHFLVMEYVDGNNLEQVVRRQGPMDPVQAAHYIRQAAQGLQHAHQAGLVHRDIKPANLIVDRAGIVKVLDLGLARFFRDEADTTTKQYDSQNVLGTADFLAPEQAVDSHNVDARADIYSLGLTFYYLLVGACPFEAGSVAQKLIWHQMRQPKPIQELRPEVPEGLVAIVIKMTAKQLEERYQTLEEVIEALTPWTQEAIPPPRVEDMPQLCPAARGAGQADGSATTPSAAALPATARPSLPGKAAASAPGSAATDSTVVQALASRLAGSTAKTAKPDQAKASGSTSPKPEGQVAPSRRQRQRIWIAAAVAGAVVVAAGLALWGALFGPRSTTVSKPEPEAARPADVPASHPPETDDVSITVANHVYHVRTPHYEAIIEADGCLNSLRLDGVEVLASGVKLNEGKSVSRGSYFYYEKDGHLGAVKLPNIEQPARNVIQASGDKFSVRYEFGADTLSWKVTNATDHVVPFYIILDSAAVNAMINGQGEAARVPVERRIDAPLEKKWETTSWFAGRAKVTISGGTRIWGPFGEGQSQVWEASLHDYETRELVLKVGVASDAEVAKTTLLTGEHRIQMPQYEALVAEDGCLPSLRVEGVEFLKPGVDISRGIYFHQNGTLKLPAIEQPAENVIIAKGEKASIRYEFGPSTLALTVTNATDQGMAFFIVFHPDVSAVTSATGDWEKPPVVTKPEDPPDKWRSTTWFAGGARLRITGGTKVWGPWNGLQVWEASLAPRETRKVTLDGGVISDAEAAHVTAITGKPVVRTDLLVQSPKDYQVFQRRSRLEGQISVAGRVRPACDQVEVRLLGKSLAGPLPDQWQAVSLDRQTRKFTGTLPTNAGGWYNVEVRALKDRQVVAQAAVAHVGVGEVFVGAGQSNSTNCAPERLQQRSGMVASFSGTEWQLADDPQPGVHDNSTGGSYWPAFGDALYAKYQVPIGIASTGHSGTSVSQWQPNGELFRWMVTRMQQLGRDGFRAVLWHQGESDVGMAADEYARRLTTVIQASKRAAGWEFP
jgi:serine/threonine protein kinase